MAYSCKNIKYRIKETGKIVYGVFDKHGMAKIKSNETGIYHVCVSNDEYLDKYYSVVPLNELEYIK